MPRVFQLADVSRFMQKTYGRDPKAIRLKKAAQTVTGRQGTFSAREAWNIIKHVRQIQTVALTKAKVAEIRQHLLLNQKAPPVARLSLEEIARKVSHPSFPMSARMIKKVNSEYRKELVNEGRKPVTHRANARMHDPQLLSRLRAILAENHNLKLAEALQKLGVSKKQLQSELPRSKTSFRGEVAHALKAAVQKIDSETQHSLLADEIAGRLKIAKGTVFKYWYPRGKESGTPAQMRRIKSPVLSLIAGFTNPESGEISVRQLSALTGRSNLLIHGVLKTLVREGAAVPLDPSGERVRISQNGFAMQARQGRDPRGRSDYLRELDLEGLKRVHDRLIDARFGAGVGIHGTILKRVQAEISTKEKAKLFS